MSAAERASKVPRMESEQAAFAAPASSAAVLQSLRADAGVSDALSEADHRAILRALSDDGDGGTAGASPSRATGDRATGERVAGDRPRAADTARLPDANFDRVLEVAACFDEQS